MCRIGLADPAQAAALIDRDDAPAGREPVDPGQRQRIDHEAQGRLRCQIERNAERGADGAGMHDERCRPGCDPRETQPDARDLILKALAARRPCVRGIAPELRIGVATRCGELVMPPAGPVAKILLAEFGARAPDRAPVRAPSRPCGATGWHSSRHPAAGAAASASNCARSPRSAGASGAWIVPATPSTAA